METTFDYAGAIARLENKGKELYGEKFGFEAADRPVIYRLICYFMKDAAGAEHLKIDLKKGIMLTGPVGCGKTSAMDLMRYFQVSNRHIMKSCRDVSFEFIKTGYDTIQKYSLLSFQDHEPRIYCFDDLGTENNIKFYGNECNVMAEILLSRYDLFHSRKLITHITTNLSAGELEQAYGSRVRSRMREMVNLISFPKETPDKRS